jgi:hypothetical protein
MLEKGTEKKCYQDLIKQYRAQANGLLTGYS